jgi:hypothetical protein
MTILSPARRVATFDDLEMAGDYTGPDTVVYPDGERKRVLFLLPIHNGKDWGDHPDEGSGIHGVTEPPWVFTEQDDGSLEIRASIGCGPQPYYWHGYLDAGNVWRQL